MTTDELEANKAVVIRAWAAYSAGDAEAFAACLANDWREYDGDGNETRLDDERNAMALHRVAFPDKRTEVQAVVAEGDLVAAMTMTTATHSGAYFDAVPTASTSGFTRSRCTGYAMVASSRRGRRSPGPGSTSRSRVAHRRPSPTTWPNDRPPASRNHGHR